MKKNIQLFVISVLALPFSSCSNFLEVENVGRVTIPSLFADMDGIRSATTGMYSKTYDYYDSEFYEYPEVAGNMVDFKLTDASEGMIFQYNFTSTPEQEAAAVGHIWQKIYVALGNTNNILQYQPSLLNKFPENANELQLIKAQALFVRALCHFDLCRSYAQPYFQTPNASHIGVPVLKQTPGADDNVSRASVKEVYDFIKSDLLESEQLFGTTPMVDAYHVSQKATRALLSRVYLYSREWDNVIKYSTLVINASTLSKNNDYLAMYTDQTAGTEAIFRLNGKLKSQILGEFYSSTDPVVIAADTLMSLYTDTTDVRLKLFKKLKGTNKYATLKYSIKDTTVAINDKRYDPIVLRVSEMYLNRAEAYLNLNLLDKATSDLKVIIARSLDKEVSEINVAHTDKTSLAALIEKERAKELCFEGHNFFDIIRQGKNLVRGKTTNSTVKFMAYPSNYFVLPIPQSELDANKNMVGNPTVNK